MDTDRLTSRLTTNPVRRIGLVLPLAFVAATFSFCFATDAVGQEPIPPDPNISMEAAEPEPEWRYTRLGWQDARQWAAVEAIVHPPDRRFDNLHPAVLAMLILFSVLVTTFWASNEWEQAQVFGERESPQPSSAD